MFFPTLKSKIILICLIISSVLLILSVVLIISILPNVVENEIYNNVKLIKNTEQYDRFLELPFPVSFKVYLFNVENPGDIVNGVKPIIKEVGPYIYKQYRKKYINNTDDDEDTISYTKIESFEFDAEASGNFSDEDYITMLNAPMMSILQLAESKALVNLVSGCLKDIFLNHDTVFIKVKVKDILFNGVHFCDRHLSWCGLQQSITCKIAESKKNVDKLPDGSLQFSFFNYKAKSDDGLYTVKRGIKDVQTLGQIVKLNNSSYTHFWGNLGSNLTCDEIKGTDSTLYPPKISKDSVFQIYSTDICRYMEIEFLKEEVYKGIKGYMFTANSSCLRYSTSTKENDCFCVKQTKGIFGEDTCFLDGVIDMQPCTGVPVLLSFPHFLWADKSYREGVVGLFPNENLHKTFLTIEPETGTPLQGMERIQINVVLRPIGNINQLKNVPRVVLPLLWIEEGVSLSNDYVELVKEMYFNKVKIVEIGKWTLLSVSAVLTILFSSLLLYKYCS